MDIAGEPDPESATARSGSIQDESVVERNAL